MPFPLKPGAHKKNRLQFVQSVFLWAAPGLKEATVQRQELLGFGSSASSSGGGGISSSLGSVCSSVSGSGSCSLGSRSSGFRSRSGCCGCGFSGGSCGSGSLCRSRFFLLAASSKGSSSDHGSQDEGLVHFSFLKGRGRIWKCHNGSLFSRSRSGRVARYANLTQLRIIRIFCQ